MIVGEPQVGMSAKLGEDNGNLWEDFRSYVGPTSRVSFDVQATSLTMILPFTQCMFVRTLMTYFSW